MRAHRTVYTTGFFERVEHGPPADAIFDQERDEYRVDLGVLGVSVYFFVIAEPEYLLLVSGIKPLSGGT